MSEEVSLAAEGDEEPLLIEPDEDVRQSRWKVLVVDDDEDVHEATKFVLGGFQFRERGIELLHAHSGTEGLKMLADNPDIAVLLLDVVMETQHAGLDAVREIRENLGNRRVRIILRTGQPGYAPEREVIANYDINDYKLKTDLTATKFYTSMVSALRAWCDIEAAERARRSLFLMLEAAGEFDAQSIRHYSAGLHLQFTSLLGVDEDELLIVSQNTDSTLSVPSYRILSAGGELIEEIGAPLIDTPLGNMAMKRIEAAFASGQSSVFADSSVIWIPTACGNAVILLTTPRQLDEVEASLASIFCRKLLRARDNFSYVEGLSGERTALVLALAASGEPPELTSHDRLLSFGELVSSLTWRLIESESGVGANLLRDIGRAAILHDYGNARLVDAIWLLRPDVLSVMETMEMQTHPSLGAEALSSLIAPGSHQEMLRLAVEIAHFHHERMDGSGYPNGLVGEAIPLSARIVAVADVFFSMTSPRPWRGAYGDQEAWQFIQSGADTLFDTRVVRALTALLEEGGRL
ncbi:putative 3'3'-cGAMP-specific phosphodiesterase 2 [Gammaproteobacteria bacterium]